MKGSQTPEADAEFWGLWKAVSEGLLAESIEALLRQVDNHVTQCARIDGARMLGPSPEVIEQRTFETILTHMARQCSKEFEIVVRRPSRKLKRPGVETIVELRRRNLRQQAPS